MWELFNNIKAALGFKPTTVTNANTATATAIIDRAGFNAALFVINIGDLTDANATFAVTMEHGDDPALADAAAPAASDLIGTLAAAGFVFSDDSKVSKVGYKGNKRYLRLTVTPTGNDVGAASYACTVLLGKPAHAPHASQLV